MSSRDLVLQLLGGAIRGPVEFDPELVPENLRPTALAILQARQTANGGELSAPDLLPLGADPSVIVEALDAALTPQHGREALRVLKRQRNQASVRALGRAIGKAEDEELDDLLTRLDGIRTSLGDELAAEFTPLVLADLLQDPTILRPPPAVAVRFAYEGRTTLLAGREKEGKSSVATAIAAAVSSGTPWLGYNTSRQPVLYLALEEHLSDVAGRFIRFGADPLRVLLMDRARHPFEDLETAVRDFTPRLVVVDTLAAFTSAFDLDPGSAAEWTPVMCRLTRLARDSGTALLILHHARKSDGAYRDSSAIGANVDLILEMKNGNSPNARDLNARGRWTCEEFTIRLDDQAETWVYTLDQAHLPIEAEVLRYIVEHPGCSQRAIREGVTGKDADIRGALWRLEASRAVLKEQEGRAFHYYPGNHREPPWEPLTDVNGSYGSPSNTAVGTTGEPVPVPPMVPNPQHLRGVGNQGTTGNHSEEEDPGE